MKIISVLVICLLIIVTMISSCQSDNKHSRQRTAVEDNNSMSEKDHLHPDARVRLRKTGGIVPVEREWLFYSNGEIRHPNGEITKLEERSFQGVLSQKKIDELTDLKPDYPPPEGSADFEVMELTVRGSAGIFHTRAADSNDRAPDKLWDFLDALQDTAKRSLAESTKK